MRSGFCVVGKAIGCVGHVNGPLPVCRLTSGPRNPAPRPPVCGWVGAILLHTFVVAAILSLGERRASTDHHRGTAPLNVEEAGPHPGISDAQLKKIESRDGPGGVGREL